MTHAARRAQAALDFLISYGIAIVIITAALFIIANLGSFNASLSPESCTPSPAFSCVSYSINTTGVLSVVILQATGGTITINGFACSSEQNTTGDAPATGNSFVLPDSGSGTSFYPANAIPNPSLPTSNATLVSAYCYTNSGARATGNLGNTFTGYAWLNYSYSNLPGHTIEQVVAFSVKYT